MEKRFNIQFNGNCLYALSHYLIHRSRQPQSTINNEKARQLEDFLGTEVSAAVSLLRSDPSVR
ncbi:hypothetical protein LNQ03_13175 [Klebsiella pneumoniae subsp. pneumoniae]|nr:hypothetical protein [Klebsiella pneumoniae subsp. pneumoniae]